MRLYISVKNKIKCDIVFLTCYNAHMGSKKEKVGIVGLGIMGNGMATNFLKNGHPTFVWNRTKAVSQKLVRKGAIACSTPKEVVQKADVVFEVTANDKSSRAVWIGKNGILSGASPKKVLITSATLSVDWTDELIKKCKNQGFTFADMPLTGGRIGAESGSLTLLIGGNEAVIKKLKPMLKAISKKVFYFGPAGHGMRYKLILNFLQGLHLVGFGQALKIAKKHKMNLKRVGNALSDRPGGTITNLGWRDYQKDPDPINFSIEWITKDLSYAKKLTKGMDTPLLDEVLKKYKKAMKKGFAKKDWASVNKLV